MSCLKSLQLTYAKKLIKTCLVPKSGHFSNTPDYFPVRAGEAFRPTAKMSGLKKKKIGPTTTQLCDFGHLYHLLPQFALFSKYLSAPTQVLKLQVRAELLCYLSVCLVTLLRPTLCDPTDCSPPGSSVHRDSPGNIIGVGSPSLLQGTFLTPEPN